MLKKRVYVLNEEENILAAENEPQVFINALYVHGVSESAWLSTVFTEGGKITFKLDTRAEASILPLKVHKSQKNTPVISHTLSI